MPATQSASQINQKFVEAGLNAKNNPYIQKLIEDEDLRDEAIAALKTARSAFERASSKGWSKKKIANDKKLRRDVEDAISGLKTARSELVEATKGKQKKQKAKTQKKKHRPLRKLVFIAAIGAIIAVALNENARKMLLDTLFGAEEEFQYSSTTTAGSSNGAS